MQPREKSPALLGGTPSVTSEESRLFEWPIVTAEDEDAVLNALRNRAMSGTDITKAFESEYADWQGRRFALACNNGTAAIQSAMFGCKIQPGDEVICPSLTYWASAIPAMTLGARVVFADIDPETLCIDPKDIEHRITPRTKAIMVVHYCGHPVDMDPIMEIASRHSLIVIEDVSHAHGGQYKGRMVGSIGQVAAASLMTGKSLPSGEGGMLVTDDREIYDRALAWGHYGRFNAQAVEQEYLKPYAGLPLGGYKYRMHQMSAALGRVQLRHYEERRREILQAMNYFWDLLEGTPGIRAHRPKPDSGSDMGGWYSAHGLYVPEELGGLSVTRFCEAVRAEGFSGCTPGANRPLHLHPLFLDDGLTNLSQVAGDPASTKSPAGHLPVTEHISERIYRVPWFKHYVPEEIDSYAKAFRKVAENADRLRKDDQGNPADIGTWGLFRA